MKFINPFNPVEELSMEDGALKTRSGEPRFKKINSAYRILLTADNYTDNFGFQWHAFTKTQIDAQNANLSLSKLRFFAQTNWDTQDLAGQNVLEIGSGAGRFSQIVLDYTKANLYSVDYSNAVEANFMNNGHHGSRLNLFQASVYEMPFAPAQFDKVFCFGVLQHTPNIEKTIESMVSMAKKDSEVVVDFYPIKGWWSKVHAKYIFRPITKKWSHEMLLARIEKNVDWMIKLSAVLQRIGLGFLRRFIPIVDIYGTLPRNFSPKQLREWCVLDTFDMFSPQFDQPQRISTVVKLFEKYGMKDVSGGFIKYDNNNFTSAVVRGVKK
jgi:2-polyprenyl-3-methyl-5-hydroxy-6-metoxy-1,4-benzoquinol methylase